MQLILLLVIPSFLFGVIFYYFVFHLDRKPASKSSYTYLLLRSMVILVFSASNGYLISLWPEQNQIGFLVSQFVPGIAVFAVLAMCRGQKNEKIGR